MAKKMKISDHMLRGFALAGGKQCATRYYVGNPERPEAVDCRGAFSLSKTGSAEYFSSDDMFEAMCAFRDATGFDIDACEWGEKFPVDVVAGILAAEGH